MPGLLVGGFIATLVSTFALAVIVQTRVPQNIVKGAGIGAFVGLLLVGARFFNAGGWEQRSGKWMAIIVGHEVVMFTVAGAILGAWL